MPLLATPAIVLSSLRYGETSKIVRLATRDHGIQSAIAKGALRPKSRFGAALQVLCLGQAQVILSERRDLHTLTAFDVTHLPMAMASDLDRYTSAVTMAEVVGRVGPTSPHPEIFDLLKEGLSLLETAPAEALEAVALHLIWRLTGELGFQPALEHCVRCGTAIDAGSPLHFSPEEGGALCPSCAAASSSKPSRLTASDRAALHALITGASELPDLDPRHAAAHRRLLARFIRWHVAEGHALPALEFWSNRAWGRAQA
ncbi:MAG TPA: DNA repair protein RecO [Gemmatimonadales bacterium]|nr:DNA repair protein RecO [Gemmatimonadales bacterium]